ncbi:CoA transferase subunit A [Clostridium polynesiense]|uniref:CoA transferase subunit A n=1 Tax=Clostridium polynesiense TaxID=1325933 RepID=UPI000A901E1F|nr:3-oxoacid CoA-transferase subunit A [Clostridium polynesiense]
MIKLIKCGDAVDFIEDGMTLMIGGFLGCGSPHKLIDEIVKRKIKDLTIIVNDTSYEDYGIGKLVDNKLCKKIMASHIGTNKETGRQMSEKVTEVELIPQGTLAERIRCGGAGLGGVLTKTGIGTIVEGGKRKIEVDGEEYLLETPLRADIALIYGSSVDRKGNISYSGCTRNFNTVMAMAADRVIVEAEEFIEEGYLDPNEIIIPGILINHIVRGDIND